MSDRIVAIIGTREPNDLQSQFAQFLALQLSTVDECVITTGGAYGIDQAAMRGACPGKLDVYLPWASYNKEIVPTFARRIVASESAHPSWFGSVKLYHPRPDMLSRGARALHARNYGIIEYASLVIAFPGIGGQGGTGQGIRIAQALGIPVMQFNKGSLLPLFENILADARTRLGLNIPERLTQAAA